MGKKSNLAGKAPGTQFLHADIFTTVKASFNASNLNKQRDVSALEELEADVTWPIFSQPSRALAQGAAGKGSVPSRAGGWHQICPNTLS